MTVTSATSPRESVKSSLGAWLALGALVVVLGGMFIYSGTYGAQVRAAIERQRTADIEQENRVFCKKFGIAPATTAFTSCANDLADVRQRAEQRLMEETAGYF